MTIRSLICFASAWVATFFCFATYGAPTLAQPLHPSSAPAVIRVGPGRAIKTIAESARLAMASTIIEVDSGVYVGDVALWQQDNVTVRAVGGRVRLLASGAAIEGKGIWVVRAKGMRVEGFDFEGAAVPSRNGAGIRLDTGTLHVKDCSFTHNEIGLLTNNDPDTVLEVEGSEFAYNMRPDGHNHNLYVGSIARLSVIGSYFHHAYIGHLLKSRAAVNTIFYNRLTDEAAGRASYELEFPNGGLAYVVGNQIQQGPLTENRTLISFGAEGYKSARNELYLVGNTLVDDYGGWGKWLAVKPAGHGAKDAITATVSVKAVNNLLSGSGPLDPGVPGDIRNNVNVGPDIFMQASKQDYRLRNPAHPPLTPVDPGMANGVDLRPKREYVHPRQTRAL